MFEVKYDRDGVAIREKSRLEELDKAVTQEVVQQDAPEEEVVEQEEPQEGTVEQEEPQEESAESREIARNDREVIAKSTPEEPQADPKSSFRELREAKLKAERERDELLRRMAEMSQPQKQAQPEPEEDEDLNLGADDLAEGKHISKVDKRAQTKIKKLEDRLSQYEAQSAQERTEQLLKQKYADFDKVVTPDHIAMLKEAFPEVAMSLYANNDLYSKAVSAYTLIKKFGIYTESPFSSDKAQAIKNVNKPRPATSLSPQQGDSALTRANAFASGLTDDLKDQLFREMQNSRKGY